MKKRLIPAAVLILVAQQAFATYFVVLRDGTRYRAKDRWTMVNGKALITLENGTQLAIDPTLIDPAKSDAMNKSGLGDVTMLATGQPTQGNTKAPEVSLGTLTHIHAPRAATPTDKTPAAPLPAAQGSAISPDVLGRFAAVYENVGIYGTKATANGPYSVHVDLVADNEDQVLKAISATAYILTKLPSVTNTRIDTIELKMMTIKGGAAGTFEMNAADAQALESRQLRWEKYYVDKVIF